MALLTVTHLSKSYPGFPVLHDVSFDVAAGEIVCLLGPSGCGKTTLLRIVAGLEQPDTGTVTFAGQDLAGVPVHRRNFGLMFQEFALFPHKNVFENVAFGLRAATPRRPESAIRERVAAVLALVRLTGYERRPVAELSGGEQQRVALARSLAPGPRLLMLDEPLGSLDRTLREQVMNEVRDILKRVGVTALYVTHDQGEAFAVADRVFVMRPDPATGGRIEQAGTPQEVYRQPATAFIARFLGFANLLPGVVLDRARPAGDPPGLGISAAGHDALEASRQPAAVQTAVLCEVSTSLGRLVLADPAGNAAGVARGLCTPGERVTVLVRPEAGHREPVVSQGPNMITGTVEETSFRGSFYLMRTRHAGEMRLTWEIPATATALPATGEPLTLWLDPAAITLLPEAQPASG